MLRKYLYQILLYGCKIFRLLQVMDFHLVVLGWCNAFCICQNLYLVYETRLRKREDSFVQLANSKDYRHFENNAGNR